MSGQPIWEVKLKPGERVREFEVVKKLGEGSCGAVYLVQRMVRGTSRGRAQGTLKAAMKVEPRMKDPEDEILKMEIFMLKNLQKSPHVCRCYGSGQEKTFSWVVMSLLGREVEDIRRRQKDRHLSVASTLRIFSHVIQAASREKERAQGLEEMHDLGFIHRDVKAANLALGVEQHRHTVYVFDFGLGRQIFEKGKDGKPRLREPRDKVLSPRMTTPRRRPSGARSAIAV